MSACQSLTTSPEKITTVVLYDKPAANQQEHMPLWLRIGNECLFNGQASGELDNADFETNLLKALIKNEEISAEIILAAFVFHSTKLPENDQVALMQLVSFIGEAIDVRNEQ